MSTGGASFCGPPCPQNGTHYLLAHDDLFTITGPTPFSFTTFDGAESHQGFVGLWAEQIRVTGVRADSSSVTQFFTLDFIQDGDGPLNDFQTFFAVGFTNLLSLTFEGSGVGTNWFSIDNIALNEAAAVPLPAALPLFGSGLGMLGLLRWFRRRRLASGPCGIPVAGMA